MAHAWIIGNGPSKYKWDLKALGPITYGSNSIFNDCLQQDFQLSYLFSGDPWYCYDIIASDYPKKGKCIFYDWNPVDINGGLALPEMVIPEFCENWKRVEINPEARESASHWHFYATSQSDYESAKENNYACDYWQPDAFYVCWIPADHQIESISSTDTAVIELNKDRFQERDADARPPSGARALEHALRNDDVDSIEIIGFDALDGVYNTTSDKFRNDQVERSYGHDWVKFYDQIIDSYPKKDIVWHTKKD